MRTIILFSFFLASQLVLAQDHFFFLALDVNKPMSNTSWISDASASGVKAGFRVFINPKFSAGLDISNNNFDQYNPTETVQNATGAVTTDYFKYVYSYAATASGQYYLRDTEERLLPYVGLGLGANRNQYVRYYNIYTDEDVAWGFLARPEAGVMYKFGGRRSFGLMAAIHYDYSTNKSDKFDYDQFTSLGFQVGIISFGR